MTIEGPRGLRADEAPVTRVKAEALDWAQFSLRAITALTTIALFWVANSHVLALVERFATTDGELLRQKLIGPADRVINSGVVMALIAGTVAQVATVLLAITRYLFPATA